MSDFVGQ